MKRFYILLATVFLISNLFAQRNTQFQTYIFDVNTPPLLQIQIENTKAARDTLFYFNGKYVGGLGISTPPFNYSFQDLDQHTLDTSFTNHNYPAKASFMINGKIIAPGDTNFYCETVSYFTPPGIANDWVSFGPITIPAIGATLSWKHNYPNSNFRDGYKVHVNTVGLGAANFTASPLYTVTDNDASTATDTLFSPLPVFYSRSKNLATYAGQSVYLGFQHTANDQERFLLDDILIKENSATGIESNNTSEAITIYPNPSSGLFTINVGTTSKTYIEVYNGLGELVYSKEFTSATASIDLSNLNAGVYSMKVISSNNKIIVKEIVIVK